MLRQYHWLGAMLILDQHYVDDIGTKRGYRIVCAVTVATSVFYSLSVLLAEPEHIHNNSSIKKIIVRITTV